MLLVNRVHVRVCSLPFLAHCEEQKVNPKLTLPYWDFTIEEQDAELSFNDDLKIDSPLFQESWFGSSDPEDNVVSSLFLPLSLSLSLSGPRRNWFRAREERFERMTGYTRPGFVRCTIDTSASPQTSLLAEW